eukprot:TRINITY_DN3577_c0_g1_i1.p1 TRINITY_DN3577_c0_g1~~TRINITY_DN3577_c0_g1_i1.p1  ORF type:complete len:117 (+),score=18.29 TRINITY_DN3577_c0_g1_i1:79-429(+)
MNYLFLANALVETTAGAVALVSPKTLPMFSHVNSQGKSAARWWAVAVIALGIASFVARNASDNDVGKHAIATGMLFYHGALVYFCAKAAEARPGVPIHVLLALGFALYINTHAHFF